MARLEQIGTETADAGDIVGEIDLALLIQALAQVLWRDFLHDVPHPIFSGEGAVDRDKVAINAEDDGRPYLQVHVRSTTFYRRLENPLKHFHRDQPKACEWDFEADFGPVSARI
jgi:hypothetical protein